ncbi:Hypothetical protein, putative [Bodo saltans]|uniref:Membrane-associated protein n=1 Tax=Bodo saltans TaxID=75058 RepID=A0A0S4J552_BODSA|nr:Hypothetical protein, putative [Bodo saltans]|eukprot:CUG86357.1 Hypothetical protein, putative [Bodo saltans]
MRSAPAQLLVIFVVLSQVALQQCCGAADISVVVSSVLNLGSNVADVAVDRENNLLYVSRSCVYRLTLNGELAQQVRVGLRTDCPCCGESRAWRIELRQRGVLVSSGVYYFTTGVKS